MREQCFAYGRSNTYLLSEYLLLKCLGKKDKYLKNPECLGDVLVASLTLFIHVMGSFLWALEGDLMASAGKLGRMGRLFKC